MPTEQPETEQKELRVNKKLKFIAIKPRGMDSWLWFDQSKTSRGPTFVGIEGWGNGGSMAEIVIEDHLIEAEIYSDTLMHNEQ